MDFHSLARRDLQALCKLNAIPANITNVAMADALKSLDIVEGIEDFLNRSPERKAVTAGKVPRTGRRTVTQSKPTGDVSESVQPMTKNTRRATRRAISDEIMQESKTPAIRSSRKTVELAKTESEEIENVEKKGVTDTPALATHKSSVKEVSTAQRVYSTRRSARLTENKDGDEKEEKIDSLVTELTRIDPGDGSDNKNLSGNDAELVLQEPVEKSNVVALETVNNLEDNEVNAVQEDNTKSLVIENEKQGDLQEEIVDELGEESKQLDESQIIADEDNKELVLQEPVEKSNVVALETVNSLEDNEVNAVQEDNTKSLVIESEKQGDLQEEIVNELGEESKQLDESQIVADEDNKGNDAELVLQEPVEKSNVVALETVNNLEDNKVNAVQEDSTKSLVIENEKHGDLQEEIVDELGEDDKVLGYPMDAENSHEQKKPDESGMEVEEDNAHEIVVDVLKEKSEQCFNTLIESHFVHEVNANNVIIEDDSKVEKSLMDSENLHEQLELRAGEEYETNKNLESVVLATAELSAGGDSYLVEHMTYSDKSKDDILDNGDPEENADQTEGEMDSENSFLDEVEPSIGDSELVHQVTKADILNNDYPKEIATGTEISSVAPFVSPGEAENKPVTETPSVKGLNCVSDDKENINCTGIKFEPTEEEAKKKRLHEKSLRKLAKMLKKKLQNSNNTAEEIKVTKERPALRKLEDNCQR